MKCWYGFEANPAYKSKLEAYQKVLQSQGLLVHLFTNTAFNADKSPVDFFIDAQTHGLGSP